MVIEVDDGVDFGEVLQRINVWGLKMAAADAVLEAGEEAVLIDAVAGLGQGRGAGGEIDWGGDDAKPGEEIARGGAELARELQSNVAAEGEADQERWESGGLTALAEDFEEIRGLSGVVAGEGEMLGAAAAAEVHAGGCVAPGKGGMGEADEIAGFARAFEAVKHNDFADRRCGGALGLDENLDVGGGAMEDGFDRPTSEFGPLPEIACNGGEVGVAEERAERLKIGLQITIVRSGECRIEAGC